MTKDEVMRRAAAYDGLDFVKELKGKAWFNPTTQEAEKLGRLFLKLGFLPEIEKRLTDIAEGRTN